MMRESYFLAHGKWRTRAVEWILFATAWSFRWITSAVPMWTLGALMAPVAAWIALTVPAFRRRAMDNLELILPEKTAAEHRAIAHGAARHFVRLMVEYPRLNRLSTISSINATGTEHLIEAQRAGRGAILVTAHFGNWEAARLAALQVGCETGIIYRPFNNRYLDRFTVRHIRRAGNPVLHKGRQGMRELIHHISGGGFAMVLVDQRNSGAPFIDFMGQPAETVTVAADLALRTGAQVIPTVAIRDVANRRFDVRFEAPVIASDGLAMMEVVNQRIGAWVTEQPEQWFWFHRRWRSTIRSRSKARGPKPSDGLR